jgi:hypothetical protein
MKRDILSQIERKTKRALTDEERAAIATLLLAESVSKPRCLRIAVGA